MNVYKFRVHVEYNIEIFRDFLLTPKNTFLEFHHSILQAFNFDKKHQATFFRSNESWAYGREITLEKYDKPYKVEPLLMEKTLIGSEVNTLEQKFIYRYDFTTKWCWNITLIKIENYKLKEEENFPLLVKSKGFSPKQYGEKSSIDDLLKKIKEKDLAKKQKE